ncbi:hypothetical protein PAPYR_9817 [Paratrimastix pyriformis]|uniref:Uncharacterized protein n=1 Tax=Paratrimastix pyriformis TaxID=342808 RepID=A0ABQ8UCB0_9EUKA|nr:hypothetical protein PAPYR_9817 [Paratrimastix pyriformis]
MQKIESPYITEFYMGLRDVYCKRIDNLIAYFDSQINSDLPEIRKILNVIGGGPCTKYGSNVISNCNDDIINQTFDEALNYIQIVKKNRMYQTTRCATLIKYQGENKYEITCKQSYSKNTIKIEDIETGIVDIRYLFHIAEEYTDYFKFGEDIENGNIMPLKVDDLDECDLHLTMQTIENIKNKSCAKYQSDDITITKINE